MNKIVLKYGLISGAVAAVMMTGSALYFKNAADHQNGEVIGYAGILLSMLFVYFGVRTYREQFAGDAWGFGKAFKVGLAIMLISCLCYVAAWMVVYQTLMPDFMDKYIEQVLAQMKSKGATEEQISQEAAKMEGYKTMYKNPFTRAALTFIEPLPVGLLVTLATSFLLRRKKGE
ncbi:MAG: DUF4199 domain-containing protein [Saprospiraceae bacterium]|nr:DUF4199 domain-containing protein [Saprospiraceae bacterium]